MKIISEKIVYTPEYAGRFDLATGIDDFKVEIDYNDDIHQYKKDGIILPSVTEIIHRGFYENPYNKMYFTDYEDTFTIEAKNRGKKVHREIEQFLKEGIIGETSECKRFIDYFYNNKELFEQKAIFDFKTISKCEKSQREMCFKQLSMYCEGIYYLSGQIINQAYMIWLPSNGNLEIIDLTKEFGNTLTFNKYTNKKINWNLGNNFIINDNAYLSVGIPHTLVLIDSIGPASKNDFRSTARNFEPQFNSKNITYAEYYPFNDYQKESANNYSDEYWVTSDFTSISEWKLDKRKKYYVKPIIFLKSEYQLDGEGTESEPYIMDYNYQQELYKEKEKEKIIKSLLAKQKAFKTNKEIYKCDNYGNVLEIYNSPREASEKSGVSYQAIISSSARIQRFGGGFVWIYKKRIR